MKTKSLSIIVLMHLIVISPLFSQKEKKIGSQQWIQYYSSIKLSERLSIYPDVGVRWREGFNEISQTLARAAFGYNVKKNTRLLSGFVFLTFHQEGEVKKVEFRPYQEITVRHTFGKINAQHRVRVEERFLNGVGQNSEITDSFNYRFRYRLHFSILLGTISKSPPIYLNIGDEILINKSNEVVRNVFDSNRLLIGPAFQLNQKLSFSFTYNYLFSTQELGEIKVYTHVLWFGIKHIIDFTE